MVTPSPATWSVRGATFALWLLAAGSAAYWGLKLGAGPASVASPPPASRAAAAVDPAAIARLLGGAASLPGAPAAPAVASLASRFNLIGVAAGAASGGGAAVIAIDGKPGRPFRVGTLIDEGLILQSVHRRSAVLAAYPGGTAVVTLELPPVKR